MAAIRGGNNHHKQNNSSNNSLRHHHSLIQSLSVNRSNRAIVGSATRADSEGPTVTVKPLTKANAIDANNSQRQHITTNTSIDNSVGLAVTTTTPAQDMDGRHTAATAGTSAATLGLMCRFHMRGACREGPRCRFSHDSHQSVPIPETVCWYHLHSYCMYGESCRFVHIDADSLLANHYDDNQPIDVTPDMSVRPTPPTPPPPSLPPQPTPQSIANTNDSTTTCNTNTTTSAAKTKTPIHLTTMSSSGSTTTSTTTTTPSLLIPESRQSSEDSGYSEPSSTVRPASGGHKPNRTYAQLVHNSTDTTATRPSATATARNELCPYAAASIEGLCPYPEGQCHYIHGLQCELCCLPVLHPTDRQQQARHRDECIREHEREMELSFAVQRSLDKACGICMDIVIEKEPVTERRFGILEKCSHIFCLSCIRKWRQTKQFENRTIRACPECRVPSDFVIPSKYWYDDRSEKDALIESYKKALSTKPCKYFQQGRGECPFAGACFYLHAGPDGRRVEMPPPRQQRRRANQEGELETLRDMLLWNYLEVRDDNHWLLTLDLEDVFDIQEMGLLSSYDTDDDDDSDLDSDYTEVLAD